MSLQGELKAVLAMEKEGRRKLAAAREEAGRIVAKHGRRAEALLAQAEEEIAGRRQERLQQVEEENAAFALELTEKIAAEAQRLQDLASRNREEALARVLAWLEEGS